MAHQEPYPDQRWRFKLVSEFVSRIGEPTDPPPDPPPQEPDPPGYDPPLLPGIDVDFEEDPPDDD